MITLGMMQFTAVVLMVLLTLKLLRQRGKRKESHAATQARRWMMAGTATLALHFALQLHYGLRLIGITQSVMLNLTMLIPASYIFAIAVLLLQRRGKPSRMEWLMGPVAWVVVMVMLAVAIIADGQPLLSDTQLRRTVEMIGAVLYMLMQGYYTWRLTASLLVMRHALRDYYDHDTDGMLRWMQTSIAGLVLLALMVPLAIFGSGGWLLVIAFAVYYFIFDLVDSFCYYLNSPAPAQLQEAEQNADEIEKEAPLLSSLGGMTPNAEAVLSPETMQKVEQAVAAWTARGGYRQSLLLQPFAAADIGIPKYQLKEWLQQQGLKYSEWIAALRIDEAKRVMKVHPKWTNDNIADHCGFSDRTAFQRTFKRITNMTPLQYADCLLAGHHSEREERS